MSGYQILRGVYADRTNRVPEVGQPAYSTDTKHLAIGDGATAGGINVPQIQDRLNFTTPTTLTIASGVIVPTSLSRYTVAAEGGGADTLVSITKTDAPSILILQVDAGDTITIEHGTDTDDITLASGANQSFTAGEIIMLLYDHANSVWRDLQTTGGIGATALTGLSDVSGATQTANFVMAAGDGATGGTFRGRALVTADLPSTISATTLTADDATFTSTAVGNTPETIKAFAAQTANLTEWTDSADSLMSAISHDGYFGVGVASPAFPIDIDDIGGIRVRNTTGTANMIFDGLAQTYMTFRRNGSNKWSFITNINGSVDFFGKGVESRTHCGGFKDRWQYLLP